MAAGTIGMDASADQMNGETRKLAYHNPNTSHQLPTLDPGTAHFELSEKTNPIGSEFLDNEQQILGPGETGFLIDEKPAKVSDSMNGDAVIKLPALSQCGLDNFCQTGEGPCLQHNTLEQVYDSSSVQMSCNTHNLTSHNHNTADQLHMLDPGAAHFQLSEKSNQIGSEFLENEQRVLGTVETSSSIDQKLPNIIKQPEQSQCALDKICQTEEGSGLQYNTSEQVSGSLPNNKSENKHQLACQSVQDKPVERCDANEQLDPPSEDIAKCISPDCLERCSKRETHIGSSKSMKKKYRLRSLGSSDRVLRSRMREKAKSPELNTNMVNVSNDKKKRRERKQKDKRRGVTDELSRTKARLRYFLSRVSYEQNLIDAYSGEGWKGYSIDKLKPEKELQRAKSEILQLKLKIRDLFRHLDTLCAEGRLPESLFDSEGEICSEDIFCAKCRSKDLTIGNDIILCDGACDRGFHQFCLEPPLLTENIPADDLGWLCPGCDCKDDCFELLNDSFGTSLSVSDSWERVFPEAAAAAGNKVDHDLGLPSDDSDDDDFNPDVAEDEEVEGCDESSSDESVDASASEEMEALRKDDPYLGLPSEDSEDNDYDPNRADHDNDVAEENSSSDFTSDSEDLADVVKGNTVSKQKNDPASASSSHGLGPFQEATTLVSGKRNIERLDYKKLYDETYQDVQSDSSDSEDWTATTTSSRRKKFSGKAAPVSPDGSRKPSLTDYKQKEAVTPRRNNHQNRVEDIDNSPTKSLEGSRSSVSNAKKPGSSTSRRLGDDAVKVLYKNFKENQYPDRATKESMAQETGLTFRQVSKWFENARWSFRHPPPTEDSAGKYASKLATSSRVENEEALGDEKGDAKSASPDGNVEKSKTPSSGKRKLKFDSQESNANC